MTGDEIVWMGGNGREVADFLGIQPPEAREAFPCHRRIGLAGPGFDESGETVTAEVGDTIVRIAKGRYTVRKAAA